MRRHSLAVTAGAAGALFALAALGFLHHQVLPLAALVVGALAAIAVLSVRGPWAHLPAYIGLWLDLGAAVATVLLASAGHGAMYGLAYVVLRAPELITLISAASLVALATVGLAYTHLRLASEVEAQERRLAELQRGALESRLSALSAQIHPHFLFNTLNTLAEVVHEDEDAAEDLVTDLAAMMRTTLAGSSGRVPLARELDLVRRLLRIESARLGERLSWTVDEAPAEEIAVPCLLIQPLVENAVKHAVASRAEGGRVEVGVTLEGGRVLVRIADDGPGLPEDIARELISGEVARRGTEGAGGGLRNCVERLKLAWPDGSARLRHEAGIPGTCLLLDLPRSAP